MRKKNSKERRKRRLSELPKKKNVSAKRRKRPPRRRVEKTRVKRVQQLKKHLSRKWSRLKSKNVKKRKHL